MTISKGKQHDHKQRKTWSPYKHARGAKGNIKIPYTIYHIPRPRLLSLFVLVLVLVLGVRGECAACSVFCILCCAFYHGASLHVHEQRGACCDSAGCKCSCCTVEGGGLAPQSKLGGSLLHVRVAAWGWVCGEQCVVCVCGGCGYTLYMHGSLGFAKCDTRMYNALIHRQSADSDQAKPRGCGPTQPVSRRVKRTAHYPAVYTHLRCILHTGY
jgi:hypothetical protein